MKKIIAFVILIIVGVSLQAQEYIRHEFSISGAAALGGLNYKPTIGKQENGLGTQCGLGYTYFVTSNIGLSTGVNLAFYNSTYTADKLTNVISGFIDSDGDRFDLYSQINNYKEKQTATYLNIPIMLQYETSQTHKFYVAAGMKLSIPINAKYTIEGVTLKNEGYFPDLNNWATNQEFMGFGSFIQQKEDELELNLAYILSVEAGIKWSLSNNLFLYTGLYFDYGLNNITKEASSNFIAYDETNATPPTVNSVLASNYSYNNGHATTPFSEKANLISTGIKLTLSFGKLCKKEIQQPSVKVEKQEEVTSQTKEAEEANAKYEAEARIKAEQDSVANANKIREQLEKLRQQDIEQKRIAREQQEKELEIKILTAKPIEGYSVNEVSLSAEKETELNEKIAILKKNTHLHIICEGYTCNLGSDKANEKIGMQRAETVKQYIINNGIAAERITTLSKGKVNPIVSNDNEENRRKNRRVEFVIAQ